ncbi:hypothetical protein LSAT2_013630, partial [Lamellibrachia satsuma]
MGKTTRSSSLPDQDPDIDAIVSSALARQEEVFMKQMAVQQTAFQACLQSFLEATNKRFLDVVMQTARDAAELKASVPFTQNEVDNIKKSLHEKSDVLDDVLDDVVKRIEIVASVQHETGNGIDYLENQPRPNNLRIDGVAEGNADTWADTEGN